MRGDDDDAGVGGEEGLNLACGDFACAYHDDTLSGKIEEYGVFGHALLIPQDGGNARSKCAADRGKLSGMGIG